MQPLKSKTALFHGSFSVSLIVLERLGLSTVIILFGGRIFLPVPNEHPAARSAAV